MAGIGRKARREAAHGAKTDKPKRYEPRHRVQDLEANSRTFDAAAADANPLSLALVLLGAHAGPAR